MAKRKVVHLRRVKKMWGGEMTGTSCHTLATLEDGMNITDNEADVTCTYCRRTIEAKRKKAAV